MTLRRELFPRGDCDRFFRCRTRQFRPAPDQLIANTVATEPAERKVPGGRPRNSLHGPPPRRPGTLGTASGGSSHAPVPPPHIARSDHIELVADSSPERPLEVVPIGARERRAPRPSDSGMPTAGGKRTTGRETNAPTFDSNRPIRKRVTPGHSGFPLYGEVNKPRSRAWQRIFRAFLEAEKYLRPWGNGWTPAGLPACPHKRKRHGPRREQRP
ncbi:hypothetical protein BN970_03397 [Mycolicibacterium conceptionense]|uniref:Uncharacterized protein n=1 Tax=Mycolicibacterium conceptionense TaxID=451644 RepID=A0A0U1DGT4_9MYCO|nr:hypothetical protein BN970_03397 [Mycolicibacterium conceptionense]